MPIAGGLAGMGAGLFGISNAMGASNSGNAANQKALAPYEQLGQSGINALLNPQKSFQASPGFNWALQQGENAVTGNAAVNGLLRSGGTMKALDTYATGAADQDYNNWWNQQQGLVNTGLSATNSGIQSTEWNANNQGNLDLQQANVIGSEAGALTSPGSMNEISNLISQYGGGGGSSYGG